MRSGEDTLFANKIEESIAKVEEDAVSNVGLYHYLMNKSKCT